MEQHPQHHPQEPGLSLKNSIARKEHAIKNPFTNQHIGWLSDRYTYVPVKSVLYQIAAHILSFILKQPMTEKAKKYYTLKQKMPAMKR